MLGACGGGGGGGDTPAGNSSTGTPSPPAAVVVTLGGVATYESVPSAAGGLSYAATVVKPIRGAVVEIVNAAGTTLTTTRTDGQGAYSVLVPPSAAVSVRVKAQMMQSGVTVGGDVSVRDNTASDAIYAVQTPVFQVGTTPLVRNVSAPSGWTGSAYGTDRAAAPFAILDTIYTTQAKLLSVAPSTTFPSLRVFWSVNNRPANGSALAGEIGSTAFTSTASGFSIYVLGRENVDTDEYDASVIAHEWGHYYQAAFSRDDSPGGSHSLGNRLDRRVAFSEGWGNAWSGIALDRDDYTDSYGAAQGQAARVALATGAASNPGWYREDSIQSILWNLNRQVGFKPMHDAFIGPFRRGAAVTSIHTYAAAFAAASPANAPGLAQLLTGQNINGATSDPFGTAETNNGGVAAALPMYQNVAVGISTQVCVSYQAGLDNRLGNYAYLRFTAPTARNYVITASGGTATDPDLAVWGNGSGLTAMATAPDAVERVSASLPAGDAVVALHDYNNSIASPCFTVTIQ